MEFKKVLEEALGMAESKKYSQDDLIAFVRKRMDDIQNPHKALEAELADLVSKKTPPGGELYRERLDKSELAVGFFRRVYGKFYEAQILYSHYLRAMDLELYTRLANTKVLDKPILPSKTEFNEHMIKAHVLDKELLPRLARAVYRQKK